MREPKLYFLDTGLLCYLLNIRTADDLRIHNMRGPVFETYVISEIHKQIQNRGMDGSMYYWRDSNDREIDLLVEWGATSTPVEIKSARTINSRFFDIFGYWRNVTDNPDAGGVLVYGGQEEYMQKGVHVLPATGL